MVSSMLAVGVSLTVGQIMAPLRNGKLVSLALLANFVLIPLGALMIARLLRLDEPLGIALLLLGTAVGAPFLPKLAGIAKSNLAFAVGLMVLRYCPLFSSNWNQMESNRSSRYKIGTTG